MAKLFIGADFPTQKVDTEHFSSASALAEHLTSLGIDYKNLNLTFIIDCYEYCCNFICKPECVLLGNFVGITKADMEGLICCCAQLLFDKMDYEEKNIAVLKIPLLVSLILREVGEKDCMIFI